ncbi:MAG: hypothetical protein SGILL_002093 [Bacillariaceae sp.]
MASSSSSFYSHGKCQCGAISLGIDTKPLFTYNCHCSHCRGFSSRCRAHSNDTAKDGDTKQASSYHSAAAVWKWNVAIQGHEHIEYEKSKSLGGLFSMARGRCRKCHEAIWESGERAVLPFAMVMGKPLLKNIEPEVDIYYDSGYQLGPTTSKVIKSDVGSLCYELFLIIFVAIPLIPWSIFKRMMRSNVDDDVFKSD